MKTFKQFTEGVTQPDVDIKHVQRQLLPYKKWLDKKVKIKTIGSAFKKIMKPYTDHFALDLEIVYEKEKGIPFVINGAYAAETIGIILTSEEDEVLVTQQILDYIWTVFPGAFKHEMLHWRQDDNRERERKTHARNFVKGNLTHDDEIEAYAMNAADELQAKYGNKALSMVKSNVEKAIGNTTALDYLQLRNNKKVWPKFIQKVVRYLS